MTSTTDHQTEAREDTFTPPYRIQDNMDVPPPSPYTPVKEDGWEEDLRGYDIADRDWENGLQAKAASELKSSQERLQQVLFPLLGLSFGSVFFLFGLLLLLFGQDGILTLQWNADRWYFFLIPAAPLLYYGWKRLPDIID